uniref:Period circadian protein homolog 2 n=1 Tax=Monopterus albus TaxID=43700 RepID=A0A3Q3RA45_MONAL
MASSDSEGCGGRDRVNLESGLGLASEGSDSSHDHPTSPGSPHDDRKRPCPPLHEDVEMGGSGSSGSGTESHGNESHGNESHGNESVGSSNGNGKDSALLESSGSNKSSEQSAKAKTQKELFKTLKELKMHLPSEKRSKGKSSTVNTLKYALRCVKQVKANEEYYQMLMINDSQPPGFDVSSYTIEEINSITSEYTLKNTDIFAVAVSLITGKIVYISDQAASILNCKQEVFNNAKFVEFLTPQDVSVFYSFTTPYRLPSWSMCTGAESSPTECMQEKSFFCRISGGKEHEGDLQYYPFRMTPYLMKVQDAELAEEQFCCLLLAERVHSGYEAPRIPPDKRIFTTTHTPNCVFQDVDERAVPLLGYLPQDLIGTPVLLNLHPSDRPLMLAVHRKILQYAGQPFDHSSIRFCARNGEYITIDTSWSSFVNPWSRKVSFVIGRHKVRMGPVNEDVFAAPAFHGGKIMDSDIQEISEQIHRLLLQPVHNIGSSGYGSHGSNGSHEQLVNTGSSSESNGNMTTGNTAEETGKAKPARTFQEICKGVHMLKNQDSQVCLHSHSPSPLPLPSKPEQKKTTDNQTVCSYQQISCLDSVIRYLESCNIPITVKRKYQFSSNTTSSNSDDDKKALSLSLSLHSPPSGAAAVVGGPLAPLTLPSKAESVVSITSQCSYSSTIVHVGDKKPQPESGESLLSPPSQEKETYKRLGLTKQVLAAHTQKEEQAFLNRCRELRIARIFQKDCSTYLHKQRGPASGTNRPETAPKKGNRNRKYKKPRMKHPDSSDSAVSNRKPRPPLQGLNQTSWSPSEASQSAFNVSYPAMVPAYPLYPPAPAAPAQAPRPDPSLSTGFGEGQAIPCADCLYSPAAISSCSDPLYHTAALHCPAFFPSADSVCDSSRPFPYSLGSDPPKAQAMEPQEGGASGSSTPASAAREPATSPPLFESRCSSPLQLNLLSMEEGQRSVERQEGTAPCAGGQGSTSCISSQNDCNSSSYDLLDILLQEQEDSHSGTGSATSASMGSGSGSGCNGCGTSASGASGSRTGHNTSKYFGSIDSLEHDPKAQAKTRVSTQWEGEHFIKYVLQEPLWLLMANADDKVMMTYQMPSSYKMNLKQLFFKSQPHFSSDQRRELVEEHPWMRRGGLPAAINVKECVYCEDAAAAPIDDDLPDMHMGELGEALSREVQSAQSQSEESQPQQNS